MSKGRIEDAYKIVFKKKKDIEFPVKPFYEKNPIVEEEPKETVSCCQKFKNIFKEMRSLYGPPKQRRMACICHYTFCITSLSYYITGKKFCNK